MADTLLSAMRQRLRDCELALDASVRAERRARDQFEHRRIDIDTYVALVRETTEASCDVASLALAVGALERLNDSTTTTTLTSR